MRTQRAKLVCFWLLAPTALSPAWLFTMWILEVLNVHDYMWSTSLSPMDFALQWNHRFQSKSYAILSLSEFLWHGIFLLGEILIRQKAKAVALVGGGLGPQVNLLGKTHCLGSRGLRIQTGLLLNLNMQWTSISCSQPCIFGLRCVIASLGLSFPALQNDGVSFSQSCGYQNSKSQ